MLRETRQSTNNHTPPVSRLHEFPMGAYTDDDKDSDAALLDSLEGVVRADTKRMLARVADDDEIPVALLRRMALKAGATLDCFVKMHRKKRRAVELTLDFPVP